MGFGYFYQEQSEQFAFYKIPKTLFTDVRFQKISTDGKILYGLLLDRVSLSRENGWIDEEGRVYIIYTLTSICQAINCAEKSAIKYLSELETFGLIERVRQGLGKPSLIYVKNFSEQKNLQFVDSKNNSNHIISEDDDRMECETYLFEQLEIESLKKEFPYDLEMIDEMADLILDVLCSNRKTIRISGDEKSANVVKSRFMKLGIEHMRYVINCFKENTTRIKNIKQYILAALYNAPATMNSYYCAEVKHDIATGKI